MSSCIEFVQHYLPELLREPIPAYQKAILEAIERGDDLLWPFWGRSR